MVEEILPWSDFDLDRKVACWLSQPMTFKRTFDFIIRMRQRIEQMFQLVLSG